MQRIPSRDEWFSASDNREAMATAIFLYAELRKQVGNVDWDVVALDMAVDAKALGVAEEMNTVISNFPYVKITIENR